MRRIAIGIVVAMVIGGAVRPADAQGPRVRSSGRTWAGAGLILGGAGAIAGAFNYRRDCSGYRSTFRQERYFFDETYDYCTTWNDRHVHVEETPWDIRLARRPMLYAGLGAIAFGTLLSTVWSDVPVARDLDVRAGPGRFTIGWTFGF